MTEHFFEADNVTNSSKLGAILIELISLCAQDNVDGFELDMEGAIINGQPQGDWRLSMKRIRSEDDEG